MQIPSPPEANTIFISGPVSSGKSWLIQQWVNSMERSITIDITAECFGDDFTHIWHSPRDLGILLSQNPYYYRISYHPSSRKFFEDFRWVIEFAWLTASIDDEGRRKSLPRWLIVDEMHEICPNNPGPVDDGMDLINRYARHNLLGFIGASQSIFDVHRNFTRACRMVILFHTNESRDLEAIRQRWGKSVEDEVKNLRPCIYDDVNKIVEQEPQCLVWIRGKGTKIFNLGDKIKTKGVKDSWQEPLREVQTTQEQQSLEHPTGEQGNP